MTDKLKPCPFCGCADIRMLINMNGCDIWCDSCHASIFRSPFGVHQNLAGVKKDAKPKAVMAWNRRADNDR